MRTSSAATEGQIFLSAFTVCDLYGVALEISAPFHLTTEWELIGESPYIWVNGTITKSCKEWSSELEWTFSFLAYAYLIPMLRLSHPYALPMPVCHAKLSVIFTSSILTLETLGKYNATSTIVIVQCYMGLNTSLYLFGQCYVQSGTM